MPSAQSDAMAMTKRRVQRKLLLTSCSIFEFKMQTSSNRRILDLLVALVPLAFLQIARTELVVLPHDTEALVNRWARINCSSSIRDELIHWYHYHVGESTLNYVYYKGQFNQNYAARYRVQTNEATGSVDLVITSVELRDAGKYACQDDGGQGSIASAELIVLEDARCQSNAVSPGLIGPNSCNIRSDELRLSCTGQYRGNVNPILEWILVGGGTPILSGIKVSNTRNTSFTSVTIKTEINLDNSTFVCRNSRSDTKTDLCSVGPVSISYAVSRNAVVNITKESDNVTCSAITNLPCTYRWCHDNDTHCPLSCNQDLWPSRLGAHKCEAKCTIEHQDCTFLAMEVFVYAEEEQSADTTGTILLAVLVPLLLAAVIAMPIAIFVYKTKANREIQDLTRNNEVLMQTVATLSGVIQREKNLHTSGEQPQTTQSTRATKGSKDETEEQLPLLAAIGAKSDVNNIPVSGKTIESETAEAKSRAVTGFAILKDILYIGREFYPALDTYHTTSLAFRRSIKIKKLVNPLDIVSCPKNLCTYIMDIKYWRDFTVHVMDGNGIVVRKWETGNDYGCLSVTKNGNVVMAVCDTNKINVYTSKGELTKEIQLSNLGVVHPLHAIQIADGDFVISHGCGEDDVQRVCFINSHIEMTAFTNMIYEPAYLAVASGGDVFVVEQSNNRVLRAKRDSDWSLMEFVAAGSNGLRRPHKLLIDEAERRLYVADNVSTPFGQKNGRVWYSVCGT